MTMSLHSGSSSIFDAGALVAMAAGGAPSRSNAELIEWAMAVLADAERRIANLQARIDYLEGLSVTDELTGLFNRRGIVSQLGRALASARRGGPRGALLICDLDGFKEVNDRHGHAGGDEVLRRVARIFALHLRRSDMAARLGGDEFALLLIGASEEGAAEKAATLRQLIGDGRFVYEGAEMRVTASIGCAFFTGAESEDDLIHCADMEMYADKRRPRPPERRGRPRLAVV
jgi:diguanylate cyclase (GGDEF)-like protein